jgi:hypothetical protein
MKNASPRYPTKSPATLQEKRFARKKNFAEKWLLPGFFPAANAIPSSDRKCISILLLIATS